LGRMDHEMFFFRSVPMYGRFLASPGSAACRAAHETIRATFGSGSPFARNPGLAAAQVKAYLPPRP